MIPADPVLHHQIPVIQKIIQDEIWLEGERRGCHVAADDRVVRDNVCKVILRVGGEMREAATRELARKERAAWSITMVPHAFDWVI